MKFREQMTEMSIDIWFVNFTNVWKRHGWRHTPSPALHKDDVKVYVEKKTSAENSFHLITRQRLLINNFLHLQYLLKMETIIY